MQQECDTSVRSVFKSAPEVVLNRSLAEDLNKCGFVEAGSRVLRNTSSNPSLHRLTWTDASLLQRQCSEDVEIVEKHFLPQRNKMYLSAECLSIVGQDSCKISPASSMGTGSDYLMESTNPASSFPTTTLSPGPRTHRAHSPDSAVDVSADSERCMENIDTKVVTANVPVNAAKLIDKEKVVPVALGNEAIKKTEGDFVEEVNVLSSVSAKSPESAFSASEVGSSIWKNLDEDKSPQVSDSVLCTDASSITTCLTELVASTQGSGSADTLPANPNNKQPLSLNLRCSPRPTNPRSGFVPYHRLPFTGCQHTFPRVIISDHSTSFDDMETIYTPSTATSVTSAGSGSFNFSLQSPDSRYFTTRKI